MPLLVAVWIVTTLWRGNELTQEVYRIRAMDAAGLEAVLDQPGLARNKFIPGAVAMNPNATAQVLHRIVMSDLPELHEPMGSYFDVMGTNTHGLAVMRLVARNAHTAPEDLERLAGSRNRYVLDDVAASSGLSEATLRKLMQQHNNQVEWGVARNSHAPPDLLATLAMSKSEYTRQFVAANPNTSEEVLAALSTDAVWHVRAGVARNPSVPRSLLESLRNDADERVKNQVKAIEAR